MATFVCLVIYSHIVFAKPNNKHVIPWATYLGVGGGLTYEKNNTQG